MSGGVCPIKVATTIILFCSVTYGSILFSNSTGEQKEKKDEDEKAKQGSKKQTSSPEKNGGKQYSYVYEGDEKEPDITDVENLTSSDNGGCSSSTKQKQQRQLPDYNTPIQVDKIRLSKIKKFRRKDLDGQSLIGDTLKEMKNDAVFQETSKNYKEKGQRRMSLEERKLRRRSLESSNIQDFQSFVRKEYEKELEAGNIEEEEKKVDADDVIVKRKATEVLQLNIGLYCNQACSHCHVESSPKRTEMMSIEVADKCLEILKNSPEVTALDLTGGAPELNATFRHIVKKAREIRGSKLDIIDRCNLTVLHEPNQADLVGFLKEHKVHIIASLPCYSAKNVNQQRGNGVFERSVSALLMLNEAGYGSLEELQLDLVYNPLGSFLPPSQAKLEKQYKKELEENFGIIFNKLYTMTNMPIKRFADFLHKRNELQEYMDLLVRNFNYDTLDSLMCTNTISIGYDGKIFDCDFNQQLGMTIGSDDVFVEGKGKSVFDIDNLSDLNNDSIRHDSHCFGCTAGMGSS